jgi:hypothetical protein
MSDMTLSAQFSRLMERAQRLDAAVESCHRNGGHHYGVTGFSEIAHPAYEGLPDMKTVQFQSYLCRCCGNRVSVAEGRAYERMHHRVG